LSRQKVEFSKLRNEKEQQSEYHQRLQKKERELRDLLRQQRQVEERLQKEIERLIAEEAKRAMEKGQTPRNVSCQIILNETRVNFRGLFRKESSPTGLENIPTR
jgi:predicted transcriptional regulator